MIGTATHVLIWKEKVKKKNIYIFRIRDNRMQTGISIKGKLNANEKEQDATSRILILDSDEVVDSWKD